MAKETIEWATQKIKGIISILYAFSRYFNIMVCNLTTSLSLGFIVSWTYGFFCTYHIFLPLVRVWGFLHVCLHEITCVQNIYGFQKNNFFLMCKNRWQTYYYKSRKYRIKWMISKFFGRKYKVYSEKASYT